MKNKKKSDYNNLQCQLFQHKQKSGSKLVNIVLFTTWQSEMSMKII